MGDVIDIYGLSPLQKEYCFILYTIKMMNILFLYCTSRFLARGQLDVATFEKLGNMLFNDMRFCAQYLFGKK